MIGLFDSFTHHSDICSMFQTDAYCVKLSVLLFLAPVSSPRRFRAKVLSPTKLHVSWKEPKGEFESYKVIYATVPGKSRDRDTPDCLCCSASPQHAADLAVTWWTDSLQRDDRFLRQCRWDSARCRNRLV